MRSTTHEAREYHLYGEGLRVVFHRGDGDSAKLEYNDKLFSGRALYREQTAMGLVVSALVEASPDLHTAFFSVFVPEVHCPNEARSVEVSTFGVLSTKRTSIAGTAGVSGQVDRYEVVPLRGNAW